MSLTVKSPLSISTDGQAFESETAIEWLVVLPHAELKIRLTQCPYCSDQIGKDFDV
jgi:hypothetical protein